MPTCLPTYLSCSDSESFRALPFVRRYVCVCVCHQPTYCPGLVQTYACSCVICLGQHLKQRIWQVPACHKGVRLRHAAGCRGPTPLIEIFGPTHRTRADPVAPHSYTRAGTTTKVARAAPPWLLLGVRALGVGRGGETLTLGSPSRPLPYAGALPRPSVIIYPMGH